jgi:hypothetical protein
MSAQIATLDARTTKQLARSVSAARRALEQLASHGLAVYNVDQLDQPFHDIVLAAGLLSGEKPIPFLVSSSEPWVVTTATPEAGHHTPNV